MWSWYDILSLKTKNGSKEYNKKQVEESGEIIRKVLDEESEILKDSRRVFVGGFSQGGCMSLHVGLSHSVPLAGLICYSGLRLPHIQETQQSAATPVLIHHGMEDDVISWTDSHSTY